MCETSITFDGRLAFAKQKLINSWLIVMTYLVKLLQLIIYNIIHGMFAMISVAEKKTCSLSLIPPGIRTRLEIEKENKRARLREYMRENNREENRESNKNRECKLRTR